jgi:hypothetical protein
MRSPAVRQTSISSIANQPKRTLIINLTNAFVSKPYNVGRHLTDLLDSRFGTKIAVYRSVVF